MNYIFIKKIGMDVLEQYLLKRQIENIIGIILTFICLFIVFYIIKRYSTQYKEKDTQKELSDLELNKVIEGYTVNALKQIAYDKFIEIQKAKTLFDYETLKKLCTEALYSLYFTKLETLKKKKLKNVMGEFECLSNKLIDIDDNGKLLTFKFLVEIQYYDSIVKENVKDINLSKGRIHHKYILEFIRAKETEKDLKCPNCGAKVDAASLGKCAYCGSFLSIPTNDFVLSLVTKVNK